MFSVEGWGPSSCPDRLNLDGDYEVACGQCEFPVVVDMADRDHILMLLRPDRRAKGGGGVCLTRDFDRLGLLKGDRLEPSEFCSSVIQLRGHYTFPDHSHFLEMVPQFFDQAQKPFVLDCIRVDTRSLLDCRCPSLFLPWPYACILQVSGLGFHNCRCVVQCRYCGGQDCGGCFSVATQANCFLQSESRGQVD